MIMFLLRLFLCLSNDFKIIIKNHINFKLTLKGMSIITRDNKNFVVQISRILYSKKYHKPQQVKKEKLKKNIACYSF